MEILCGYRKRQFWKDFDGGFSVMGRGKRIGCLIDELGYVSFSKAGLELLFKVISHRHHEPVL